MMGGRAPSFLDTARKPPPTLRLLMCLSPPFLITTALLNWAPRACVRVCACVCVCVCLGSRGGGGHSYTWGGRVEGVLAPGPRPLPPPGRWRIVKLKQMDRAEGAGAR